jgi:hypothetical protein
MSRDNTFRGRVSQLAYPRDCAVCGGRLRPGVTVLHRPRDLAVAHETCGQPLASTRKRWSR